MISKSSVGKKAREAMGKWLEVKMFRQCGGVGVGLHLHLHLEIIPTPRTIGPREHSVPPLGLSGAVCRPYHVTFAEVSTICPSGPRLPELDWSAFFVP